MFGVILKATNSSFQKGMTFCRSIYKKKIMKLLAFIFEQPSYVTDFNTRNKCYTQKLLKQGYRYHKLAKPFLNFIDHTMI